MQPIFMIGMQRSGSNLLRLMLNQLDQLACPHPPHILQRMFPLLSRYGDLSDGDNFLQLAEDVCRLVELNPVPWTGVELDASRVAGRCGENSLVALHGAVYDLCAEAWGANAWCCKSLANIQYADEIERYFEAPKYIYLYRDGRDVAMSFRKAVVGEKHIYNVAKGWGRIQALALELQERIDADRFFSLSYEDLILDSANTARRLCEFLGVPYTDSMLDFHRSDEARRAADSSSLWGNLTQPLLKNNTQKFLNEASVNDIRIFESVAGHFLQRLGYPRYCVREGEELRFSQADIDTFNVENKRLKREVMGSVNQEDLDRRNHQERLLTEIASRSGAEHGC
jgi:hypothetical protein